MSKSKKLYMYLLKEQNNVANEDELRQIWVEGIKKFLSIPIHLERDRNDASYNQVIIEFKDKGLFKGKTTSLKYREAIYDRLKPYILRKAEKEKLHPSEYTGIAIDGEHIVFAYMDGSDIKPKEMLPFSESAIEKVTSALLSSTRRTLTAENLIEDFGFHSEVGKNFIESMFAELQQHLKIKRNNKVKMLFEEWRTLFGQVATLSKSQEIQFSKILPIQFSQSKNDLVPSLLFVIHTYNALIMKLLGAEIISNLSSLTSYKDFCEYAACLDDEELFATIDKDIERGLFFEHAGIKGFAEEAIFSWYLNANKKRKKIANTLRHLLIKISLYRMDVLDTARTKDVLKVFYQNLVPDFLRKSLGEFYTPDWLVDYTLDATNTKKWESVRVLDPTCGSGSFLLQVIKRKRNALENIRAHPEEIINHLVKNVWGFDLNPLAVQAARVNFLIAIADLFPQCGGLSIEMPILLADSIYSPARNPLEKEDVVVYKIGSTVADLTIFLPEKLALNRYLLDRVFQVMENSIEMNYEFEEAEKMLLQAKLLTKIDIKKWRLILAKTYNNVLNLHRRNWNGIWFRIVRNFFWSATAGEFDLIVGNPPWVRWSNLPLQYREKIKDTCKRYDIFSNSPYHGGNELDVSGMITYTVADKWLKNNGDLVFIITQTHFQSPSSEGFRSFKINDDYYLVPKHVDDLKKLKPFSSAANKTSIVKFKKQKRKGNIFPLRYTEWDIKDGFSKTIPENLSKDKVLCRITREEKEANPVGNQKAPWAIMSPGKFDECKVLQYDFNCLRKGRKGITTDLNSVYIVKILEVDSKRNLVKVKTRPEAGKKKIGPAQIFWVEPDLLYPVAKGAADFTTCFFSPKEELYMFVPNKGIRKKNFEVMQKLMVTKLRKTENYFKTFKTFLMNRSTFKGRYSKHPYYAVYNVGDYTFAPYKVIWAEQSGTFKVAVMGKKKSMTGFKPFVADHKIYFVEYKKKEDAYFLCGLLSSSLVREYIESHTISIQVSNIFKHLHLPCYNKEDIRCVHLARITEKAHKTKNQKRREMILKEIDFFAKNIILSNRKLLEY